MRALAEYSTSIQFQKVPTPWNSMAKQSQKNRTCNVDEGVKKDVIKSNMLVLLLFLGGIIIFITFEKTKT